MRKVLVIIGIIVAGLVLLGALGLFFGKKYTKQFSPEQEVAFNQDDLSVTVYYNRPFKKGRVIFGELVPYGKVWRTGANEATIFKTNKDLIIEGQTLKAGSYTLWTIPDKETWKVIFNKETGQWGIKATTGEANRDPDLDALSVDAHAVWQDQVFEQFTIQFEQSGSDAEMVLLWDQTLVSVPFSY
ncbi:MAG: DUF2911 domain-containing protein [Flammeovirgaceae bacterium]|nr:DUF2911 domain-containing protein [Flammeovirgaceae bacterium]